MKSHFTLFIALLTNCAFSQIIHPELISCKGLSFRSSKHKIISTLGQPKDTYNPNYECGFLSGDYITLDYGAMKLTGNKKEGYLIEEINLESDSTIQIKYGKHVLTNKTKLEEIVMIFGIKIEGPIEDAMNDYFHLPCEQPADDAIRVYI